MTYNHAAFIKQAMEGVLMQKTNFDFEVVVGDDFSTDNTLEIIKSFSDNERIKIKILKREPGDDYWTKRQELGRLHNFVDIIEHCSGKYVALLDGDDYWTDPNKLQKQVDFLEANPDCILSFHNVNTQEGSKLEKFHKEDLPKSKFNTVDLFEKWFIPTSSIVFRKDHSFKLPTWLIHTSHGDLSLLFSLSFLGSLGYINEVMSVYRLHESGVSKKFDPVSLIATYSFVFVNVVRDSNYKLRAEGKDALIRFVQEQVVNASNHLTDKRTKKIIEDTNFASENIPLKELLKAALIKIKRRTANAFK